MLEKIRKRFLYENERIIYLPIESITPNPAQPRKIFSEPELRDLANSIRENGVLQPITVRRSGNRYQLVAGERRLRASALAGLKEIPCIISNMDDKQSSLIALVENLQRCDLDYFEEAVGIYNLIQTYGFSQEEAAKKLGKSQSAISNKLRLLKLDPDVMKLILRNGLSERHARALLRLESREDQLSALDQILEENMNVSQTDAYIEHLLVQRNNPQPEAPKLKPTTTYIFKDVRLFLNTINHAVDTMRNSGIKADIQRDEDDSQIRMTIHICKR